MGDKEDLSWLCDIASTMAEPWSEPHARHLIVETIRYARSITWPADRRLPPGWVNTYVSSIDAAYAARDMALLRARCDAYRRAVDELS